MSRSSSKVEPAEDAELFLAAVKSATPLANRDVVAPTAPRTKAARRAPAITRTWKIEHDEACGTHRGRVDTVNETTLAQLERGRIVPTLRLDLHGHTLDQARAALAKSIRQITAKPSNGTNRANADTCLLLIHGKGRHSNGTAVLREQLPEMVSSPALAAGVVAFASALPRDGGSGATYLLVRCL